MGHGLAGSSALPWSLVTTMLWRPAPPSLIRLGKIWLLTEAPDASECVTMADPVLDILEEMVSISECKTCYQRSCDIEYIRSHDLLHLASHPVLSLGLETGSSLLRAGGKIHVTVIPGSESLAQLRTDPFGLALALCLSGFQGLASLQMGEPIGPLR